MDSEGFIKYVEESVDYRGQIVHVATIPARAARYGKLVSPLHSLLRNRLEEKGISQLYSHQAASVNAVVDGKHVVVVTSTASGKTLCYNLPVLQKQLTSKNKRALYLFPTKALAQDQLRKLNEFNLPGVPRIGIYDGDTSARDRQYVRKNCDTVITNPDMLHAAILPNHGNWSEFFHNLEFIVIDEMHIYRGIFGAHVANVIRRLRRICRHYGSAPQFIGSSATIGNPLELMNRLAGVKAELIDDDGSPSGERVFLFWNPPYVGEGIRKSTNFESAGIFLKLVRKGIRNIAFTKSRVAAELIYRYAKENLADRPELVDRIMAYRGGYTPAQRREIERGLFDGSIVGVSATNALELGIDIGGLDACVLAGYPGSISSTWQRAGRAGRGAQSSLAIFIAENDPLDQFLMRDPAYLLDAANERAILDAENPYVTAEHMLCAAYEIPISPLDLPLFGGGAKEILGAIEETGQVVKQSGKHYWSGRGYPAATVNIRSAGGDGYRICLSENVSEILGTVESSAAFRVLHRGAVYLHLGESYIVDRLDIEAKTAYVSKREVDYFTVPQTLVDIRIGNDFGSRRQGGGAIHFGDIIVKSRVLGFWRKKSQKGVLLESVELEMPFETFETTAIWLTADGPLPRDIYDRKLGLEGGLHGAEHAIIGLLPLHAMCDRSDVGGASHPEHQSTGMPTIFIYDSYPGGVGISESIYARTDDLIGMTLESVSNCECLDGCPSCIQSAKCGNNNTPLDKYAAISILSYFAGQK